MKRLIDKYSDKVTLYQNSFDTTDVRRWLKVLDKKFVSTPSSLCINYDIYGEGEARLAWHDQLLEIQSSNYKAMQAANGLIKTISQKIEFNEYPIGHLKFLLNGEKKISITHSSREEVFDNMVEERKSAGLLINARVQTSSEALSHIVSEAIAETEIKFNCTIEVKSHASFLPGYPKPVYRITD